MTVGSAAPSEPSLRWVSGHHDIYRQRIRVLTEMACGMRSLYTHRMTDPRGRQLVVEHSNHILTEHYLLVDILAIRSHGRS